MQFEIISPIHGFENSQYATLEKIDDLLMRLTLSNNDKSTFMLVNPFMLRDYDFEVPDELSLKLDLDNSKDISIGNIMIASSKLEDSAINFIAPIVFNMQNNKMAQVILDSVKYPDFGIVEPIKEYLQN